MIDEEFEARNATTVTGQYDDRTRSLLQEWDLRPGRQIRDGEQVAELQVTRKGVKGPAGAAVLRTSDPAAGPPQNTEHIVFRRWAGAGAVRLLAADPARGALLLENPATGHDPRQTDLRRIDLIEACGHLGALLVRLAVPAPAQLQPVSVVLTAILELLHGAQDVLPRRMIDEAAADARSLLDDGERPLRVAPTALDFRTVQAATREPYLATSGLALAGDPEYAVAGAVWGRPQDAARAHRLRLHLRLRLEVVCDVAGLDERRARAYAFLRTAARIAAAHRDGTATVDQVTDAVATMKAMQG